MMLLCTRVAVVAFLVEALYDRLFAAQCNPLGPMGFHSVLSDADFLL
jgi:hypothetical protein